MHSVLLVMSVMGSTVLILYFLLRRFLAEYFPLKTRLMLLQLSLLFYLLPFPIAKNYYYDILDFLTGINWEELINSFYPYKTYIYFTNSGNIILPKISAAVIAIALVYFIIVLIKAVIEHCLYKKLTTKLNKISKPTDNSDVPTRISVRTAPDITPVCYGIVKPVIVLPEREDTVINEFVIKHELAHISSNDHATRLMLRIVQILHWYNPLVYILSAELKRVLEYQADENATKGFSPEKLKAYQNAVVDLSVDLDPIHTNAAFSSFGSSNKKIMKARLTEMKKRKEHKRLKTLIGTAFVVGIAFVNSFMVFAYKGYPSNEGIDDGDFSDSTTIVLVPEGEPSPFAVYEPSFEQSDDVLVDENGNEFPIKETDSINREACSHTYVSYTEYKHTLNGSGGCTVKQYNSKRCAKCGKIVTGSLVNTTSYTVCPH